MNENLIAGYAAYTTADEYAAAAAGDAPGTFWLASVVFGTIVTMKSLADHC